MYTTSAPGRLQQLAMEWLSLRSSAVLEVPSAVVEQESNFLLNPEHPDFSSIEIGPRRPFKLDPRLIT